MKKILLAVLLITLFSGMNFLACSGDDDDNDTAADTDTDTDTDSDTDTDTNTSADTDTDTDTDDAGPGDDDDDDDDDTDTAEEVPWTEDIMENFDSYADGDMICDTADNPLLWQTWYYDPGNEETDAVVSSDQSVSPTNSLYIEGSIDTVLLLKDRQTGAYQIDWQMFVEADKIAYFNVLQGFWTETEANSGADAESLCFWGLQVFFDPDGVGFAEADYAGNAESYYEFTFPYDTWFPVSLFVDLDNDTATFTMDEVEVCSWQWSLGSGGTNANNTLAAIDFYGPTADTQENIVACGYYVDDVSVKKQ